jgi:hypothetical protein
MATLVLAFDSRLDCPLPGPARLVVGGVPGGEQEPASLDASSHLQAITRSLQTAPLAALEAAAAEAIQRRSLALVLFGDTLDPRRASPAQAAALRQVVLSLGLQGCKTICVLDEGREASELVRALGAPDPLLVATPAAPASLGIGSLSLDVASDGRDGVTIFESFGGAAATRWQVTGSGMDKSRGVSMAVDPGLREVDPRLGPVRMLPALQPRGHDEPAGACGLLRIGPDHADDADAIRGTLGGWLLPTQQVLWRTLTVDIAGAGSSDAIASVIVAAVESLPASAVSQPHPVLPTLLRVRCRCGTVAGRMRLADLAAEAAQRVRSLYCPRSFPFWCEGVEPDPDEPLDALWRSVHAVRGSSGDVPRTAGGGSHGVEMFAAELVALACGLPRNAREPGDASGEVRRPTGACDRREAAWLALELLEVA